MAAAPVVERQVAWRALAAVPHLRAVTEILAGKHHLAAAAVQVLWDKTRRYRQTETVVLAFLIPSQDQPLPIARAVVVVLASVLRQALAARELEMDRLKAWPELLRRELVVAVVVVAVARPAAEPAAMAS